MTLLKISLLHTVKGQGAERRQTYIYCNDRFAHKWLQNCTYKKTRAQIKNFVVQHHDLSHKFIPNELEK